MAAKLNQEGVEPLELECVNSRTDAVCNNHGVNEASC